MLDRPFKKNADYCFAWVSAVFLLMAPATANAEKSNFIARFKEIAVYDSNPLLRTHDSGSIKGSETTVSIGYDKETTKTKFRSSLSATRNQFNDSKFSSTDFHGFSGLKLDHRRWQLSLDVKVDYDTTRTSELTTLGLDIDSTRRSAYSLAPGIFYSLSPRDSLSISGNWNETRYDDNSLTDYRTYSITPAFAHNISPKQLVQFGWLFNRYQSLENSSQRVNTNGPSVSWTYVFRPYLSLKLSGSLLKTRYYGYTGATQRDDDYTPTYSSVLNYTGDNNALVLSMIKARHPYANGTESYLTTYALQDIYNVNRNLSLNFGADYQDAKQPPLSTDSLDSTWSVIAGASYKVSRNWDMTASYKHKEQTLVTNNNTAAQDIVKLGLSRDFQGNQQ